MGAYFEAARQQRQNHVAIMNVILEGNVSLVTRLRSKYYWDERQRDSK